jgi:hypothetical protein
MSVKCVVNSTGGFVREIGIAIPAPRAHGSCAVSALVSITYLSKKKILDGLREIRPETCKSDPGTRIPVLDSFLIKKGYKIKIYEPLNIIAQFVTIFKLGTIIPLPNNIKSLEDSIKFVGEKKAVVCFNANFRSFGSICHAVSVGNGLICDNTFAVPSPFKIWKNAVPFKCGEVTHITLIEKEPE